MGLYWRNTQSRFGGDPRDDNKEYQSKLSLCVQHIYLYAAHVIYNMYIRFIYSMYILLISHIYIHACYISLHISILGKEYSLSGDFKVRKYETLTGLKDV